MGRIKQFLINDFWLIQDTTYMNERVIGEYTISTDKARLDITTIHDFLANQSYWAIGIPIETVRKFIDHCLTVGVYHQDKQVGFARVITDYTTFAYLADVFIIEEYRKKNLTGGSWLCSGSCPDA